MARLNQKKYRLHVSITTQNHTEEDVLCQIELPKRATEPVTLVLLPTREQLAKLGSNKKCSGIFILTKHVAKPLLVGFSRASPDL